MSSSSTLREEEIRPDSLMCGQAERFAADVRRLMQRRHEFVHVPCPACGGDDGRKAFEKCELSYVACAHCETMYTNPRPSVAILEWYYATSENYSYWSKYIFPASEDARRRKIFRPRAKRVVDICKRLRVGTDVLLEVGAGFGTFCEEVGRLGVFGRVIAVEPTPDLAESCRRRGLEVIQRPIEQVSLEPGSVNVIAGFEVIEHLFAPRDFVSACASILAPGGLLVLSCPNVKGFDIMVLREFSESVDAEHLNYFHPASLSALVAACGLVPVEVLTPGKLDVELVRKKVLAGEFDLTAQPFLKHILIDDWKRVGARFQRFLAENLLSSHMWIVARKP